MDAAGQTVALQEELVAELQRDVTAAPPDGQSATTDTGEDVLEVVDGGRPEIPRAQSLEEAKSVAREAMHTMDDIVEEYRGEIAGVREAQEDDRQTSAMKRIAEIKTKIGVQP